MINKLTRRLLGFLLFSCFSLSVIGQERLFDMHIVRLNALPLAIGSYNVSYETPFRSQWSAVMSANFRPMGNIPFEKRVSNYYTDNEVRFNTIKGSNFSITPEIRYYFLPSSALRGFYFGTFMQYAQYGLDIQLDYVGGKYKHNPSKFDLDGTINTVTVGAAVGHQWRISELFYLDWQIIGPNFGLNKGHAQAVNTNGRPLDSGQEQDIHDKFKEFNIPMLDLDIQTSSTQVDIKTCGAWAGARIGLSFGYRF